MSSKQELFTGVATAAALLAAAVATPAVADHAPTHDWTGPYIGVLVAHGSVEADAIEDGDPPEPFSNSGFMGGGTVGINFQDGHMVYGIEGDVLFGDIGGLSPDPLAGSFEVGFDADLFATVRGRAGVAADYIFLYGTAGLAILDGEAFFDGETNGVTALGGVFGAGAELALNKDVSFKAELLHAIFDETSSFQQGNFHVRLEEATIVRFGLNMAIPVP